MARCISCGFDWPACCPAGIVPNPCTYCSCRSRQKGHQLWLWIVCCLCHPNMPLQKAIQDGKLSSEFSSLMRTFHAMDEHTKFLAGDACCFHEPRFNSTEEMVLHAHENLDKIGAVMVTEHLKSSLEVSITWTCGRFQMLAQRQQRRAAVAEAATLHSSTLPRVMCFPTIAVPGVSAGLGHRSKRTFCKYQQAPLKYL